MVDTRKWVQVFNEKFLEFIKDLIETFPNDKDFKLCKQSFSLLQMVDERKPSEMFRAYALKYQERIMMKDESFFLKHDFKEELDTNQDANFSLELLVKLKTCWSTLLEENKNVIWSYLQILYKINDKI